MAASSTGLRVIHCVAAALSERSHFWAICPRSLLRVSASAMVLAHAAALSGSVPAARPVKALTAASREGPAGRVSSQLAVVTKS